MIDLRILTVIPFQNRSPVVLGLVVAVDPLFMVLTITGRIQYITLSYTPTGWIHGDDGR